MVAFHHVGAGEADPISLLNFKHPKVQLSTKELQMLRTSKRHCLKADN